MDRGNVVFISGIDTDIGKTIAVGLLGRYLSQQGCKVITQKIVQTGCAGISDDILRHRALMGMELQDADRRGLTCPYVFPEPCSPHLAASLVGREIERKVIRNATDALRQQYDWVLLEGVGGLLVPLHPDWTLLDYIQEAGYPLVLVSSPRLGSINHTLSGLELAKGRGLHVRGILYNRFLQENSIIADDSVKVFRRYMRKYGFPDCLVEFGDSATYDDTRFPDFKGLFTFEG